MEFFYKNKDEFMKYEIEAAERIKKKYDKKVIKTCNNYKYDFKTDDLIKYEVKAEPTSLKTNNFLLNILVMVSHQGYPYQKVIIIL